MVISVGWQCRQSFSLYGFGSGQIVSVSVAVCGLHIFGMVLVFMFKVILPELREKVYDGRAGSQPQSGESSSPCPTQRAADFWESAASRDIFLASSFSCSQALSHPAQNPLTPTVGHLVI